MKRFGFSVICLFWLFPALLSQTVDITSLGAINDGKTLNTTAIQAAIDSAHEAGGGQVLIPQGRFLTGTIILKSNVELHISENAVLLGSTEPKDYLKLNRWKGLVMADHAENISITGQGTIDGQGAKLALHIDSLFYIGEIDSGMYELPMKRPLAPIRPQVIEMVHCKGIVVSGITIQNGACWVSTYDMCEDMVIDSIRIDSDEYWNNDGIDLVNCKNAIVRNSYVNAADDGICLKSYIYEFDGTEYCENILIENCTVRSSASAVKLGTASYGGFRNVVIRDIKVFDTFRSAIALEAVDGGFLENVLVENITATNTGNAIFIRLAKRSRRFDPGTLKNVTIRNMTVEVPFERPDVAYKLQGPALPFFHNIFPASITGIPGHDVENVHLENIEIRYPGKGNPAYANMPLWRLEQVPEQIGLYPEFSMFGELPAWGFYVRHVRGLTMEDIRLSIDEADYRPAMVFDDVQDLMIKHLTVEGDDKTEPVFLHQTERVTIEE